MRRRAARRVGAAVVLLAVVGGALPAAAQVFVDVTSSALPGLDTAPGDTGGPPYFTGGAAAGDCDGDGLPDLYFTGYGHDVLYRNRGDGVFEDVTVSAGLGAGQSTRGAAFADVDNDGDLDIYATGYTDARHFLYINDGTCRFTEQAEARGVAVGSTAIGRSASFGDYDRDGYLDLYVTELQSDVINPGAQRPISHLFHNRGATAPGFFDDVTDAAGVALDGVVGTQSGTFAFVGRFADLDRDGWPDLTVISDFHESRLFWNDGHGHFVDGTTAAGVGTEEHGMGVTTGDLDGDGLLDLFVSSIYVPDHPNATGNRLYRYAGGRTFQDVTSAAGVRSGGWGWGTEAFDVDNDGDLDLVLTNGGGFGDPAADPFVGPELGDVDFTQFQDDPVRLWKNDGHGTFTDVAAASGLVDVPHTVGQGVLTFDMDGDGDLDVVLTHDCCDATPRLFRNDGGNAGHWLDIALTGKRAQRQGVGAIVTVTPAGGAPIVREVSASSTYFAQDGTARLHVGLGNAIAPVDGVRVEWPSGTVQTVHPPTIDGLVRISEDVDEQTRAQRDCIIALNAAGARLATAIGQRLVACVHDGTMHTLPAGQTAAACVAGDPLGGVAQAEARTEAVAASRCTEVPLFGPRTAADVNAAVADVMRPQDVFGPDLDAALRDGRVDRAGALCQQAVARAAVKTAVAKMKAFDTCKAVGLRRGTIHSAADLAGCHAATESRKVARVVSSAYNHATRLCAAADIASAFPGKCAGASHAGFAACLEAQASCGVCMALNGADGLGGSCHRFASGVATTYCGDRPPTTGSIARQWDEAILDAIRHDTPRPTVHARNLFHLSAVMWDAWRAYGGGGHAWLTDETHASDDPARDREIAISFAAYRLLAARYAAGPGAARTEAALRADMYALGFDPDYVAVDGDDPAAVGNRIAGAMLAWGHGDGANDAGDYADTSYAPVNPPLVVKLPGTTLLDPNRWQPLALDLFVTQNGITLPAKVQTSIGMRWDGVAPFALVRPAPGALYVDPGPPPQLGGASDAVYKESARRLVELSGELDASDGALVDVSPGAIGNNPLGSNAGTGHPLNPATGQPYPPNVVPRGDFLRVMAEFWADGPNSETPPGHWNVIANDASDRMTSFRIGGAGPEVDRLEWDVKMYVAVNGAVHDAAIVAWGLKRRYDSVRPISMIRHLAGQGQSSDPSGASYAPDGIPLQPGLIEVITAATTAPGQRHEALAGHEGEIAVHAYDGPPADSTAPAAGARWIRGVTWMPYQKPTFVTPAFPGYISGHSTFSRAAAEVLTRFTGDAYEPGGLAEHVSPANTGLSFERGPSVDVAMQWATYYDAADLAGQSRLAGGIHITPDDFNGRIAGSQVGIDAWDRATALFATP